MSENSMEAIAGRLNQARRYLGNAPTASFRSEIEELPEFGLDRGDLRELHATATVLRQTAEQTVMSRFAAAKTIGEAVGRGLLTQQSDHTEIVQSVRAAQELADQAGEGVDAGQIMSDSMAKIAGLLISLNEEVSIYDGAKRQAEAIASDVFASHNEIDIRTAAYMRERGLVAEG